MIEKYDHPERKQEPPQEEVMPSCLLEYDPKSGGFRWKFAGNIPVMAMVGALELLKSTLLDSQKMQMAQAQLGEMQRPKIVTPNGQKIPNLRM